MYSWNLLFAPDSEINISYNKMHLTYHYFDQCEKIFHTASLVPTIWTVKNENL